MSLNVKGTKPKSFYVLLSLVSLLTAGALIWLWYPKYIELMPEPGVDQSRLLQSLETQGIDFKVDAFGAMLIEESALGKGKIAQAKDRQAGFDTHGLELYDQADYSMTEHTQQVTLMRALQGELERTLGALDFVRYARVHLTFGEKKMFEKQPVPAKSAVTIFPEHELNRAQVDGIQTLVAAAVPGLKSDAVTILDENGRVLSRAAEQGEGLSGGRMQQQIELEYRQKIENLLGLLYAPADYSVVASVELVNTEKRLVRQQLLTDSSGNGVVIQKQQSNNKHNTLDGAVKPADSSEQLNIHYAHGTATEEVTEHAGTVARVALSVLIRADASNEKQQKLQQAIEAAVGFSKVRGDLSSVLFVGAPVVHSVSKNPQQTVAVQSVITSTEQPWPLSDWLTLSGVLLATGFVGALFWRRRQPVLSLEERQEVLAQVEDWMLATEAKHG